MSWTTSTSNPVHVSRVIAGGWQGDFSLTIDLYVGSNRALLTAADAAATAVQMKELISRSDGLTGNFE